MKHTGSRLRLRIALIGLIILTLVWIVAAYEIARSKDDVLHDANLRTAAQSQVFAEYSESTIKRLDELTLDLRDYWAGDWRAFADLIQRRQAIIQDIAFQVAVIDRDGLLAFSNLARPDNRTDLSQREHFQVHKAAPGADRLFISKALKGKISGKWSIQFTRPIYRNGEFDGVLVVSVSPELFSNFATKLQIPAGSIIAVLRDSGEMMARYPVLESSYGQVLKDRHYLLPDAPIAGNDRRVAAIDGTERLYGYYKLPAQQLIFVIGEPVDSVLVPYQAYRDTVLSVALFVSVFAGFLFFGLIQSLAALDKVRRELEAAKEKADAANLAKSKFLATMSHEIRTPMNGILGMAQLMMASELTEGERQEYARIILSSGQTLLNLLNDILDLSKVEAGRVALEHLVFSPASMIREVAALFSDEAQAKGLAIEAVWHGAEDAQYRADPLRLRQMLTNLMSNAVKFSTHGVVRLEASPVKLATGAAALEFAVSDAGIGIAEDKLALLFKPFSQVDNSTTREYGGTGLGLSIVRSLAHLMGGEAGVASKPGEGSRFWFRLPVDTVDVGQAQQIGERLPEAAAKPLARLPASTGYVLVVEDNPTNCKVIEALLKKLGLPYVCVGNGEEALAAVTAGTAPDIVLMDCQMPVMDGFAATRAIRDWETANKRLRLPIIALTADAFPEDRERCLAVGMDDFLSKPISFAQLQSVVAKWSGTPAAPPPAAAALNPAPESSPPPPSDPRR
jgi:signal transduction histidine kinase/DNA-binding NarL/FixJ family response regulator